MLGAWDFDSFHFISFHYEERRRRMVDGRGWREGMLFDWGFGD